MSNSAPDYVAKTRLVFVLQGGRISFTEEGSETNFVLITQIRPGEQILSGGNGGRRPNGRTREGLVVGPRGSTSPSFRVIVITDRLSLSTVGGRAFPVAASRVWNELPRRTASAASLPVFCSRLETHLFSRSLPTTFRRASEVNFVSICVFFVVCINVT